MKTIQSKLLAVMVIMATITIATVTPAKAQRRETQATTRSTVQKNASTGRNTATTNSTQRSNSVVNRSNGNSTIASTQRRETNNTQNNSTNSQNSGSRVIPTPTQQNQGLNQSSQSRNSQQNNSSTISNQSRTTTQFSPGNTTSSNINAPRRNTGTNSTGTAVRSQSVNIRTFYNQNENDNRYTPSINYRGSNQLWSGNNRPVNMNYNRTDINFYINYNDMNYKHWNSSWERYRWNVSSWREYYRGYNNYSYTFHKYYYFHPQYGHVIRRFVYQPQIFVYNNIRYYDYDGHFFRYLSGVGYVLVDVPFGIVFNRIPGVYERVHINGYLYFRVGNLFFEYTGFGFRLVHYPERYYSYYDNFHNEGYYFDDGFYY